MAHWVCHIHIMLNLDGAVYCYSTEKVVIHFAQKIYIASDSGFTP